MLVKVSKVPVCCRVCTCDDVKSKDSLGELEYNMLLTKWTQGYGGFFPTLTNNWAVILFCTVTSHCQHYGLGFVQTSEHQAKMQHVLASCLKGCKGASLVQMVKVRSRAAFILGKWQFLQLILIQEESCTFTSNVLPVPYIAASVVVIV